MKNRDMQKFGVLLIIVVIGIAGCAKKSKGADIAAVDISFVQKAKNTAEIKVIIKNNGKENISRVSYTFAINESKEEGEYPVYNFGPGEESTIDFNHAYSNYYDNVLKYKSIHKPFELKMILVLDPKNKLKETNENNNKIVKTFYLED